MSVIILNDKISNPTVNWNEKFKKDAGLMADHLMFVIYSNLLKENDKNIKKYMLEFQTSNNDNVNNYKYHFCRYNNKYNLLTMDDSLINYGSSIKDGSLINNSLINNSLINDDSLVNYDSLINDDLLFNIDPLIKELERKRKIHISKRENKIKQLHEKKYNHIFLHYQQLLMQIQQKIITMRKDKMPEEKEENDWIKNICQSYYLQHYNTWMNGWNKQMAREKKNQFIITENKDNKEKYIQNKKDNEKLGYFFSSDSISLYLHIRDGVNYSQQDKTIVDLITARLIEVIGIGSDYIIIIMLSYLMSLDNYQLTPNICKFIGPVASKYGENKINVANNIKCDQCDTIFISVTTNCTNIRMDPHKISFPKYKYIGENLPTCVLLLIHSYFDKQEISALTSVNYTHTIFYRYYAQVKPKISYFFGFLNSINKFISQKEETYYDRHTYLFPKYKCDNLCKQNECKIYKNKLKRFDDKLKKIKNNQAFLEKKYDRNIRTSHAQYGYNKINLHQTLKFILCDAL